MLLAGCYEPTAGVRASDFIGEYQYTTEAPPGLPPPAGVPSRLILERNGSAKAIMIASYARAVPIHASQWSVSRGREFDIITVRNIGEYQVETENNKIRLSVEDGAFFYKVR